MGKSVLCRVVHSCSLIRGQEAEGSDATDAEESDAAGFIKKSVERADHSTDKDKG